MPRTLPWLLSPENDARVKRESTPRKRVKRERFPDDDPTPKKPPTSPEGRDFFRSSQTPPTSPARPCPAEEFLVEGLDNDDAWVMVEDEFYSIAQSFTQHLHYAEYVRRKKEAKAQSADAMKALERPTDGQTPIPKELRQRKEAAALAARQKAALEQAEGSEGNKEDTDDDDDAWAGTHLHGLMTSPRKSRSLAGIHTMKSFTRAAAGFGQAVSSNGDRAATRISPPAPLSRAAEAHRVELDEETASDEDDDLDGAVPIPIPPPRRLGSHGPASAESLHTKHGRSERNNTFRRKEEMSAPKRASHRPANGYKSRVQMLFDDLDELPEPSRSNSSTSDMQTDPSRKHTTDLGPETSNFETTNSRFNNVPTFLL
ncbi:uncharacterized protein N7482_006763 [Penicillium canariense]|uniref:Uncharacterized protein n=1 Tax=Penicillium canariense TaxID=189055 RepID=A0A9W9HWX7_9EURO|nr:uncharacterized protein N7482_006763 [Penicillium canariense]KAJ5159759.1 hypothetical protein N7482_006763 [Penicillium canariense]